MTQINPTRMELLRLKRKLSTALRGHKLLKEKLDGLMKEFMAIINQARALREKVENSIGDGFKTFLFAKAALGDSLMYEELMSTAKIAEVTAEEKNSMNVKLPILTLKEEGNHYCYSFLSTTSDVDSALSIFSNALASTVKLAEIEHSARLLAREIEKTRRRVNALEYVFIPEMQGTIRYIGSKLSERERSEKIVLMKIKAGMKAG
jgi:V/A-type H+-transporting ATPase subunit D